MIQIFLFLLICYGITNIIANEHIFDFIKVRISSKFLSELLNCGTCLGLYVGMLVYLLFLFNISGFQIFDIFLAGVLSSGAINIIEFIKIKM